MKSIITIADDNYKKYADKLFESLNDCGWRGKTKVFSPDTIKQTLFSPLFTDCRWLFCDIIDHLDDGDQVMYFDADCVATKAFPVNSPELWDTNFTISKISISKANLKTNHYDQIRILTRSEVDYICFPTIIIFTVSDEIRVFFEYLREFMKDAIIIGAGINVSLTSAVIATNIKPHFIEEDKISYPFCNYDDSWIYHYAGLTGKKMWSNEYEK